MPKIFGIMLVNNEADIVKYAIERDLEWCDQIFVYDTGSSDKSWSIVRSMAESDSRIVPVASEDVPFSDSLRGRVFRAFGKRAQKGDWWCRLDADEIYIDNPKKFIPGIPASTQVIWSIHLQYAFTTADMERFKGPGEILDPGPVSEATLPCYYRIDMSEPRFFKHRPRLRWSENGSWPMHMGLVCPRRIRLKHFKYRSPFQIQLRLDTRRRAAALGWKHFDGCIEGSWSDKVASRDGLYHDSGDGKYSSDMRLLPYHLESPGARFMKRILHGTGIWP